MAKIPFTKLNLTVNQEVKTFNYNDLTIEVRQYLPATEKLALVQTVAEAAANESPNYINVLNVDLMIDLAVVNHFTNITFTDKQKENPAKLYDCIHSTGLFDMIKQEMADGVYESIICDVYDILEAYYNYRNSMLGMMEAMQTDYSVLDTQATEIQQKLADPENLALLKDITSKLG